MVKLVFSAPAGWLSRSGGSSPKYPTEILSQALSARQQTRGLIYLTNSRARQPMFRRKRLEEA